MDAKFAFHQGSIDPRSDYSGIERRPAHRWTVTQHIYLIFMARLYENAWPEITAVFNEFFLSELGHPDRLSSGALASMYYDIKRGILGKDAMKLLRRTAFSFLREPTLVDQDSIERTATKLGIHLIKRLPGALSKPPKKQRRPKRKAVVLEEDTDFLSERASTPRTPKKRKQPDPIPQTPDSHSYLGAPDALLTPPPTITHQSVHKPKPLPATIGQPSVATPKWLPPVAYRAFSPQSQGSFSKEQGFCAGAFVDSQVPLPPHPQSQEYIEDAKRVR